MTTYQAWYFTEAMESISSVLHCLLDFCPWSLPWCPLKYSNRIFTISHRRWSFTKKSTPWYPCPFKNKTCLGALAQTLNEKIVTLRLLPCTNLCCVSVCFDSQWGLDVSNSILYSPEDEQSILFETTLACLRDLTHGYSHKFTIYLFILL